MWVYETKNCGKCGWDKKVDEFYRDPRGWLRPDCKTCKKKESARYRDANRGRVRQMNRNYAARHASRKAAATKAWREANPDRHRENVARWRRENPEKCQMMRERWRSENPEKFAQLMARATSNYRARNKPKYRALDAARRASLLQRTPAWSDLSAIEAIYEQAVATGMTVDHVIPLRGKLVSGLHVPENLQLLTLSENSKKRNRFEIN